MGSSKRDKRQVTPLALLRISANLLHSTLMGHKKQVNCCKWNQNGNWLATGSKDGLIKLFDIRTMREIEVYKGHNSDVSIRIF
jgi:WD40 repeat protein